MISVFKKIWMFANEEQSNIKKSIGLGLLNAIFMRSSFYAIFVVLAALVTGNTGQSTAFLAVGLMLISIVGKIITPILLPITACSCRLLYGCRKAYSDWR